MVLTHSSSQPCRRFHHPSQAYLDHQPRSIVLDVGSNIGWLSLYAAAMGHEVYSFEPDPFHIVRQCQSLSANTIAAPYHVLAMAVGHQEESIQWSWDPAGTGPPAPAPNADSPRPGEAASRQVSIPSNVTVTTLDTFLAREEAERGHPLRVSFLKVDAAGFEATVIKGALGTLRRRLVQAIYVEVSVMILKSPVSWRACIELLLKLGYRLVSVSYNAEARPPEFVAGFNEDPDIGLLLLKCASRPSRQCHLLWELKPGLEA
eukprot:jgi/Mesvir1/27930/Mv20148-RA.1